MSFLRNIFGNKPAPSKPVAKSQPSPQLALLQAKGDEKLSLLRYLATCGQMDATKLEAYLSIFESFGNELGPEKKAYILKSAPMMAPKLEGGRVLNGYERLRWSFFQTHMEEVNKVVQMVNALPAEPATAEILARVVQERDKLQRQVEQAPAPDPPHAHVNPAPPSATTSAPAPARAPAPAPQTSGPKRATEPSVAIGNDQNEAATHLKLGQEHRNTGDLKAAIDEYRKAIRAKPDYAEAHSKLGAALCDAGDQDGGALECREAIRLRPDDFAAAYHLGNALYHKGDFSGAIAQFGAAIRLKPDLLEARNNLANTLYTTGDLNAAITEFRELLKLAPNFADAHNNLGSALYDNGDVEGAIREYREAIRLKPGSNSANIARENLERAATEAEFVRKCLEPQYREEKEDRKWDSPGAKEVNALLNSNKYEECARAAEVKAAENSDLDLYYDWGGAACLQMNDYDRARRIFLQGIAKGKRKSLNCSMMGQVEWKARNAKEAVYWWAQAVHCRESIKDYADESPYLYLYYVAEALGLSDVATVLIERVDRIRYSIRLNATPAADLRDLVRQQATPGMRNVLAGLRELYLKPSPPPTDLSDAEAGLERALQKIESDLKNRPNPAFSLVSLGLQATKYGKKIVWRFKTGGYDAPGTMDDWAARNFLNHELRPIGVTVSRSDMVDSARGNQFFEYEFSRTTRTQPAVDPREIGRFIDHTDNVAVAVFVSDGKRAVSLGGGILGGEVMAWDLKTFAELGVTSNRHIQGLLGVRPQANQVLLVYQELFAKPSVVRQWDLDGGNLSEVCQLNTQTIGGLRNAVFSADCRVMMVEGDKKIALWNLSGPTLMSQFEITKRINALALSANAQSVLCAESDNSIHLMSAASGERTVTLVGHEGEVHEVRFTPSGDLALSCSNDQTVRVWDIQGGKEVRCLRGHTAGIRCLDISADGKYAASGGSGYPGDEKDCAIRIWEISTGSEVARYVGHSKAIRSVRFNPSGDLLVSASADKTVRVWSLR